MKGHRWILAVLTAAILALSACDEDDDDGGIIEPPDDGTAELIAEIRESLPLSLHATAQGMRDWYNQPDGYGAIIGLDYETLGCKGCHVPATGEDEACLVCHNDIQAAAEGTEVIDYQESCLTACHGRQNAEVAMGLPDVHRDAGMTCGECHGVDEIHGDGTAGTTMFEHNFPETQCADCHVEGGSAPVPPNIRAHRVHGDDLACESCHMSASVTCYNCHFAEEVENHRKVAYRKYTDWLFLGNYQGQVHPMNFQSVEYEGHSFNAWGPFTGHTITAQGRDCNACHGNENIRAYDLAGGTLDVVRWNSDLSSLVPRTGIIPLAPGFAQSYTFDFVTKEGAGSWFFLEQGPDNTQIRYGTPLTPAQMESLRSGM
jgi:hypothetical protein